MINSFITYIELIVTQHGMLGIFFATLLEQVIAPIPSPLIPMMAGFFLLPESIYLLDVLWQSMFMIALPVSLGTIIGVLIFYFLAYWGGKPAIEKTQRLIGYSWEDVEKIKKRFDKSGSDELTIFILWSLPVSVPSIVIAIFCGIIRYPVFRLIFLTIGGVFIRTIILSLVGWQAGEFYYLNVKQIALIENYLLIGFIVLIITGLIFLFYKKRKNKKNDKLSIV